MTTLEANTLAPPEAPLTAADIMTHDVATVTADSSLQTAIRLMLARHVSGLPVMDGIGTLAGILTEGDLLRRVELGTETHRTGWLNFILGPRRLAEDYVETHSRVVGDVMTTPVHAVDLTAPLSEVVAMMQSKHIKRVPILSNHQLVGVVSRSDLLRALANTFTEDTAGPPSDEDLATAVTTELARHSWATGGGITVKVTAGIVDLEGIILEESERPAIRVATQNIPGVIAIRDHLTWIDPNSGMTYTPGTPV